MNYVVARCFLVTVPSSSSGSALRSKRVPLLVQLAVLRSQKDSVHGTVIKRSFVDSQVDVDTH